MHRLYDDLAAYWPLVSPPVEYEAEAELVHGAVESILGPARRVKRTILELGCGGGHTLSHLTRWYDAAAVDLSARMLALSRGLNPRVEHHVGDMRTVRLGRKFDAVLIHDSIDYMLSETDVRSAIATAAAHLKPGGALLIAPTYLRDEFANHDAYAANHRDGERKLTCVSHVFDPDEADTTFELTLLLLIREQGKLRIERDVHTCGMFDDPTWRRLLDEGGFEVTQKEQRVGFDDPLPFNLFAARLR